MSTRKSLVNATKQQTNATENQPWPEDNCQEADKQVTGKGDRTFCKSAYKNLNTISTNPLKCCTLEHRRVSISTVSVYSNLNHLDILKQLEKYLQAFYCCNSVCLITWVANSVHTRTYIYVIYIDKLSASRRGTPFKFRFFPQRNISKMKHN